MSINQPIFQLSKAVAKAATQNKNARYQSAKGLVDAMKGLQDNIGNRVEGDVLHTTENTANALRKAEEALENARSAPKTWWETFFGSKRDFSALRADRDAARQAHNRATDEAAEATEKAERAARNRKELDTTALKSMKLKYKGSRKAGREFIQVQSQPITTSGIKHQTVTAKLSPRKDVEPADYVSKAHKFAGEFIKSLKERSPFVSPRLAIFGKDAEASLKNYNEAIESFTRSHAAQDESGEIGLRTAEDIAIGLTKNGVNTKILQDGKFRIKVQSQPKVGKLKVKLPLENQTSMDAHVLEGLSKANKLNNVIEAEKSLRLRHAGNKDEAIPEVSYKMLRNNPVQRQVDFQSLDAFELARTIFDNDRKVQAELVKLKDKGIEVKILRNKAFRITRFDQGVVAKTHTIPFPSHKLIREVQDAEQQRRDIRTEMKNHIKEGLKQAKAMLENDLPAQIPTKQKLKNKFYPFKKAVLDFIN